MTKTSHNWLAKDSAELQQSEDIFLNGRKKINFQIQDKRARNKSPMREGGQLQSELGAEYPTEMLIQRIQSALWPPQIDLSKEEPSGLTELLY